MKFMYFFDNNIKCYIMRGKKHCNPSNTGKYECGISCIRQHDVNMYFYTKANTTIAIDAGHLNFPNIGEKFKQIEINPNEIKHVFLTHVDVEHCGGVDVIGKNIYPNAKIYIGKDEQLYLNKSIHRIQRFGIKIKNYANIGSDYHIVEDLDIFDIEDIKIQAFHILGHTLGHICYIIDDMIAFTGDCLAINEKGGYSFFDFFTQYPDPNKESLQRLKKIVEAMDIQYVCTGHSGIRHYNASIFAHIDESAKTSKKEPFDNSAPYDVFEDE